MPSVNSSSHLQQSYKYIDAKERFILFWYLDEWIEEKKNPHKKNMDEKTHAHYYVMKESE